MVIADMGFPVCLVNSTSSLMQSSPSCSDNSQVLVQIISVFATKNIFKSLS